MNLNKLAAIAILAALHGACASDDNEPDPSNSGNKDGKVVITGTSPEYTFWGDELTITGSGFSEVKDENVVTFVNSYPKTSGLKLTSKEGDIEIVSASKTKLVIRVPYLVEEQASGQHIWGEDFARIEVAVKNEKDTSEIAKFMGLPHVGKFQYHYGWFHLAGIARSGDSVILGGGFWGSWSGAGELHPKKAGVYEQLRLKVDGIPVPIRYRKISNSIQGWALFLPAEEFSEVVCAEGWGDRPMTFEFFVNGTDKKASRELGVTYLPKSEYYDVTGPSEVSKAAGGVPAWTVTGKNMIYHVARFVPECGHATTATTSIANENTIKSEYTIGIPLSLMEANCLYKVYLLTPCDQSKSIGSVYINP